MTVHPITITGEPVLHQRARPVEAFDDALRTLIADLFETMDTANGVGLAAPQIGVGLRIFVYGMENDDDVPARGVVVNPTLVTSKIPGSEPDPDEESEGCLSVPGEAFPLKRADWVRVSGFDGEGAPVEFEATGWFARCMRPRERPPGRETVRGPAQREAHAPGQEGRESQRVGYRGAHLDARGGSGPLRSLIMTQTAPLRPVRSIAR